MEHDDATNLLLGLMASDQIKHAAVAVSNYRAAQFETAKDRTGRRADPHEFLMRKDGPLTLGEALDHIFAMYSRALEMKDPGAFPFEMVQVKVLRPHVRAHLELWPRGDGDAYRSAEYWNDNVSGYWGDLVTETRAGHLTFEKISLCLAAGGNQ